MSDRGCAFPNPRLWANRGSRRQLRSLLIERRGVSGGEASVLGKSWNGSVCQIADNEPLQFGDFLHTRLVVMHLMFLQQSLPAH